MGDLNLSMLMYIDDVVILSNDYKDIQFQLGILSQWCFRWGMKANIKKSQVIHQRNHQRPRCPNDLVLMGQPMCYVEDYKCKC